VTSVADGLVKPGDGATLNDQADSMAEEPSADAGPSGRRSPFMICPIGHGSVNTL
jgi:hypothetical protein